MTFYLNIIIKQLPLKRNCLRRFFGCFFREKFSARFPDKLNAIDVHGDKLFFIERSDGLFECFFTDPELHVDIVRRAFVGNGNTAPKVFYCFQNAPGNIINSLIA